MTECLCVQGWKRNCMEMEKKYKRIAALAQRKLKIMDDGR